MAKWTDLYCIPLKREFCALFNGVRKFYVRWMVPEKTEETFAREFFENTRNVNFFSVRKIWIVYVFHYLTLIFPPHVTFFMILSLSIPKNIWICTKFDQNFQIFYFQKFFQRILTNWIDGKFTFHVFSNNTRAKVSWVFSGTIHRT